MSTFLVIVFIWSLINSLLNWHKAIRFIIDGEYASWTERAGNALMFTVLCIDSFLRIFSVNHTGLW